MTKKTFLVRLHETDFRYVSIEAESLGEARFIAHNKDFVTGFNISYEDALNNRYLLPTYKDYEILDVFDADEDEMNMISDSYVIYDIDEVPNEEDFDTYSDEEKKEELESYINRYDKVVA